MDVKIVVTTKKQARQSHSNVKVMLIVFFLIGRVLFIMSLFHLNVLQHLMGDSAKEET